MAKRKNAAEQVFLFRASSGEGYNDRHGALRHQGVGTATSIGSLSACAHKAKRSTKLTVRFPTKNAQKLSVRNREGFRAPEAYGSPRSTNCGPHAMSYGVFGFRLIRGRVAKAPGCTVAGGIMAAERGRSCLRPLADAVIRSAAGSDRTNGDIAGSAVAARRAGGEPCRIMA